MQRADPLSRRRLQPWPSSLRRERRSPHQLTQCREDRSVTSPSSLPRATQSREGLFPTTRLPSLVATTLRTTTATTRATTTTETNSSTAMACHYLHAGNERWKPLGCRCAWAQCLRTRFVTRISALGLEGECLFRVTNDPLFYSVKQMYLN